MARKNKRFYFRCSHCGKRKPKAEEDKAARGGMQRMRGRILARQSPDVYLIRAHTPGLYSRT